MLRGSEFKQMEFTILLWPPAPLEIDSEKWVKNCPLATEPIIIYRLCLIQSGDNIRNHQIQALPLFLQRFEIIRPIRYIWRISSELKYFSHSVKQSMSFGLTVFKRCLGLNEKRTFVSSVRSSNSHPDLLLTHHQHPLFQTTLVLNTGLSLSEPLSYIKAIMLYKGNHWTQCAGFRDASWVRLGITNDDLGTS